MTKNFPCRVSPRSSSNSRGDSSTRRRGDSCRTLRTGSAALTELGASWSTSIFLPKTPEPQSCSTACAAVHSTLRATRNFPGSANHRTLRLRIRNDPAWTNTPAAPADKPASFAVAVGLPRINRATLPLSSMLKTKGMGLPNSNSKGGIGAFPRSRRPALPHGPSPPSPRFST